MKTVASLSRRIVRASSHVHRARARAPRLSTTASVAAINSDRLKVADPSSSTAPPTASISDAQLDALAEFPTQALVDALWVMKYPQPYVEGARPLAPGTKLAGRAVTLRFVPHRPDLAADKPAGVASPEYQAFELIGEKEVLVAASTGPYESIGGDIKFLRLAQRKAGGIVTDGSVRDTGALVGYGVPVFSFSTTAKQGPAVMQPWGVNDEVSCGGVLVRPGDAVVGDDDGVVVVPAAAADEVLRIAAEREEIEGVIKAELEANPGSPGQYYPFTTPLAPGTPLAGLVEKHLLKKIEGAAAAGATPGGARSFSTTAASASSSSSSSATASFASASLPATMRAVRVHETGGPECLTTDEVPLPAPSGDGPPQVLVRNAFSGLNFIDTYHRGGLYPREAGFVCGTEGAGTVAATPDARAAARAAELGLDISEGAPVAYYGLGSYAEYTLVNVDSLLALPEGVPLDAAAASVVQGLTAHYLVDGAAPVGPGDTCVVHAAAGGTGQMAAQMAKLRGAVVVGTASAAKADIALAAGCDVVVTREDMAADGGAALVAAVAEVTGGRGAQAVYDGVGASTAEASLDCLATRGTCVYFGNASGPVPPVSPLALLNRPNGLGGGSLFVTRPKLNDYIQDRTELEQRAGDMFGWIADGSLRVAMDRTFGCFGSDVVAAHEYIEAGKTTGKVLLDCEA